MSDTDHREPAEEATQDDPELDLLHFEDEGTVKLFEPEVFGAYIVVDQYSLVELCECA